MDEMQWYDTCPKPGDIVRGEKWVVEKQAQSSILLVSGNIEAAIKKLKIMIDMLGLCEMTNTTTFGIRIARDKALLISDVAIDLSSGWHEEGFAASSCDDAWSIFQISGQNAEHLLRQGCSSEITSGSPSAAIGFAGQLACLVKNESANLLLYPSPMERYLWSWLEGAE